MMKKIFLALIFVGLTIYVQARTYYISATGSNSNSGTLDTTPWQTIAKVNSSFGSFSAGDQILFNRGDTFYGSIVVNKSGTSGNPIVIGAYGTGVDPIITGFTTISSWTNEGNGIYSKVISSAAQTNMVTIDGVQYGMGRTPDATYSTYESCNTNLSITDNQLTSSPDWTGAEVVIRKKDWILDRCLITNHTGTKITYTSLGSSEIATPNWGYFIQNDLRCVTGYGEWYHNISTGKFYMYFGAVDPTTKTVKVATINNLISNNSYDYITVDNITFIGSIDNAVNFFSGNDNCSVQNCTVSFSGKNGIILAGNSVVSNNNTVTYCNRGGVITSGTGNTITNNIIRYIGSIIGQAYDSEYTDGIYIDGGNTIIRYNTIENIGYNGIFLDNVGNQTVQYNFINNVCTVLDDGGGLYTSGFDATGIRTIDSNIFLNAIGNNEGTSYPRHIYAEGIYCDSSHDKIRITNNTVYGCGRSGIFIHDGNHDTITGNTCFNNFIQVHFSQFLTAPQYNLQDNIMHNNKFIAKASTQYCLRAGTGFSTSDIFVTSDYNYFARPIDEDYTFSWYLSDWTDHTFTEWNTKSGQDANSHNLAISISDTANIDFYYNASKTNKVISLVSPMIDVTGTKYATEITLLPYTSAVLFLYPSFNQSPSIVNQSFQIANISPNGTIVGTVTASDPDTGQTLHYSIVSKNTNGAFSINDSTGVISVANNSALNFDFALVVKVQDNGVGELSSQATIAIHIIPTGSELTGNNETIKVYPNPVSDELIIEIKGNKDRPGFEILNSIGQIVFEGNLSEKTVVQTTRFSPGVYLLKIENHGSFEFKKITKV